jgi:hypothetical protein
MKEDRNVAFFNFISNVIISNVIKSNVTWIKFYYKFCHYKCCLSADCQFVIVKQFNPSLTSFRKARLAYRVPIGTIGALFTNFIPGLE